MDGPNHRLTRRFFAELCKGELSDDLFTEDMSVWSTSSGSSGPSKAKYRAVVRLLQSLFPEGLAYRVDSITAEEDRVVAEVKALGTLRDGTRYENNYIFMFRIRDGRIASIAEHFNVLTVQQTIGPLMAAAMAKQGN
jgi:uncharacterized protein